MGKKIRKTTSTDIQSPPKEQGQSYLSGLPVHILFITAFASILFLVIAEIGPGWTFDGVEISFIVLLVLVSTVVTFKFIARGKRNG
jgi:hypothetical protein